MRWEDTVRGYISDFPERDDDQNLYEWLDVQDRLEAMRKKKIQAFQKFRGARTGILK